jgi:hypothetical protein
MDGWVLDAVFKRALAWPNLHDCCGLVDQHDGKPGTLSAPPQGEGQRICIANEFLTCGTQEQADLRSLTLGDEKREGNGHTGDGNGSTVYGNRLENMVT